MVDVFTTEKRSTIMGSIKSEDTGPELRLRKALWAAGLRYRKYYRIEKIKVDLAFPRARLVVFVDGCFWHGCPIHGSEPATNVKFWRGKIRGNIVRDRRNDRTLRRAGWKVLRFWEHQVQKELDFVVNDISRTFADK